MNKGFSILQQRGLRMAAGCAAILSLAVTTACDNVEWGGIQVSVTRPSAEADPAEAEPVDSAEVVPAFELPLGPVLFHVQRLDAAGWATMTPALELSAAGDIASIGVDRVDLAREYAQHFEARYYSPGATYTLFSGATRVGSFVTRGPAEGPPSVCPTPVAEGQLELTPEAAALAEFHAWPAGARPSGEGLIVPVFRGDMGDMAGVLATRGVADAGVAGRWRIRAPAELTPLRVGAGPRGFAATFTISDSLAQGSPSDSAGTVFVVADYDPSRGYFPLFFDAVWYGPGGKRALRWVDAVELTGGGDAEWLVRAHGDVATWYEVIGVRGGERQIIWSGRLPVCSL